MFQIFIMEIVHCVLRATHDTFLPENIKNEHLLGLLRGTTTRAEILVGRRSGPDREKCGPDKVICLSPDQK